jgi:hypothetical protein
MDIPEELKATVPVEPASIESHELVFVEHTNWHWAMVHFGVVIAFAVGFALVGFILGRWVVPR